MTIQQLINVVLQDIANVLTSSVFWRVIVAGVVFAIGSYYPNLAPVCNILVTALGVTVVVSGGERIGASFSGK